ncbi:MAG TPA: GntR family transcriptional regulator [Anaerolineae bacterium]|nr:GntR family transcriptional regulator [Anaerolineae bacterium]
MTIDTNSVADISRNLLSIEVANFIRREILNGTLRPGDHLIEATFAQRLQTSKSPVREAFRLLEAEGLVVNYPHRGSFVTQLDPRDVWELDTLRAVLEPFAAELALEKIDQDGIRKLEALVSAMDSVENEIVMSQLHADFHKTIIHCSGHKRIIEILDGLWAQMNLLLVITHFGHLKKETIRHDHQLLLEAIKQRNAAQVRKLFREHVYGTLPGLMQSLNAELESGAATIQEIQAS